MACRRQALIAVALLVLAGCGKSSPPLLLVNMVTIEDESYPTKFTISLCNDGGDAKVDRIHFERLHRSAGDPPMEFFSAKSDSDALVFRAGYSGTIEGEIRAQTKDNSRHRVVNARLVLSYLDAAVAESESLIFMLQTRPGALEETLNSRMNPGPAKAMIAAFEELQGEPSPGFLKFERLVRESAGEQR